MHMDEQEIVVAEDVVETPEVVVEDPADDKVCDGCS
jgi:hypothetical protein